MRKKKEVPVPYEDDTKFQKVLSIMNDMNKNLFTEDRKTDSRKISFMLFGDVNRHDNLLAIIRKMLDDLYGINIDLTKHIEKSIYKNKQNKVMPMYLLSEFGYIMLTLYISRNDLILYKEAVIRLFNMYERRLYRIFSLIEKLMFTTDMIYHIDEHRDFKFTLINNKVLMISSLELAKIFNKEHKDILSKIRIVLDNCSFNFGLLNSCCKRNKTDTYNGGYREDDVYYVTRNMYALLIACYNNTTPELIKLKHDMLVFFDKTIEALIEINTNGLTNLKKFQNLYEAKENFDYNYFKGVQLKNSVERNWNLYKEVYPGLDEEINIMYKEMVSKKGSVTITDIMHSCFYFDVKGNEDHLEKAIHFRPLLHEFLAFLGIYLSKVHSYYGGKEPYRKPNVFVENSGLITIRHGDRYDYNVFSLEGVKMIVMLRGTFAEYIYHSLAESTRDTFVKFYYEFYSKYKPLLIYTDREGNSHKIGWK